ncbi:MAG: histidinol-phosphate aminotransferase, partial [Thermosediminibacterales bacterium]|nr:histidinol-phosphate aminotransferase [Thermosediminibacterales bacterium]
NFILTRFSKGRDEVYNGLRGKRISIRKLEGEALKDCLRISVGSREDMDRMILEMKRILEGIE